jgi:hypothetical protein
VKRLLLLLPLVLLGCSSTSGGSADARVTYAPDPLRPGPVTWTVTITNDSDDDLELTFPSGQRAEVTLRREGGVVYQWSRGKLFTQVVGHETVKSGGNTAYTLEGELDVEPGEYELTAMVTTTNAKAWTVTRTVTVEPG